MKYKVKLLPVVRSTDLRKAKKWYKDINEDLAKDFKKRVDEEIDYIGNYPEHYQRKYKELRQSLVSRFPYAIFYRFEKEENLIIIFGVLHTSRNPELARKRFKKS